MVTLACVWTTHTESKGSVHLHLHRCQMVLFTLIVDASGHIHAHIAAPPQYLIFDTETDGGTPKQRCIELAFIVLDARFYELHRYIQYWRHK